MNKVARKGLVTAMVAGGVLASAGAAQADAGAGAQAAGSPGVLSGNSVQVPVHVPVNACGNTVDVLGLLNPTFGNTCANTSSGSSTPAAAAAAPASNASTGGRPAKHAGKPADESGAAGSHSTGGAHAASHATGSPGVLSGNSLQLPVDVPVNISGNSVNVVGIGNPAFGNTAVNSSTPPRTATPPPPAHQPNPAPPNDRADMTDTADASALPSLAHTGADGLGWTAGASAALLLGGALLYRKARPASRTAASAGPVGAGPR
jgi:hypothetical protein